MPKIQRVRINSCTQFVNFTVWGAVHPAAIPWAQRTLRHFFGSAFRKHRPFEFIFLEVLQRRGGATLPILLSSAALRPWMLAFSGSQNISLPFTLTACLWKPSIPQDRLSAIGKYLAL